ncbi:MAG: hypothetical protein AB7D27_12470, partial [Desulfomicrobium sp.]
KNRGGKTFFAPTQRDDPHRDEFVVPTHRHDPRRDEIVALPTPSMIAGRKTVGAKNFLPQHAQP